MTRRIRRTFAALAALALLAWPVASAAQTDDTALFSTTVPPNVVLVVDNSGSMNHIVWHPMFPSDFDPSDTVTNPGACNNYVNTNDYFYSSDLTFTVCGKSITLRYDSAISPNQMRITGRYLNWLFSPQSNAYMTAIDSTTNGTYSACIGGGTYSLYRRARITAAQDILREVICQVNAAGEVRFGLAQFRRPSSGDPNGGYIVVPVEDYLDGSGTPNVYSLNGTSQSHGAHLDDAIDALEGESWTPLAETLFSVYTYFMSRTAADRPVGQDGTTVFPEYEYSTDPTSGQGGPFSSSGPPTVPDSPVEWLCQKNFVIVITDGEPTRDDFDVNSPTNTALGFADFMNLIGDYNPDGEAEEAEPDEGTRYLDDIAMFMQDNDFRPDMADHNGQEQVIDVYTVGFTTSPTANAILSKTAQVGNGQFYFSNDPEALAADIIAAVSDIIQKSQSFTAATVPAARTSAGGQFYTSLFVPSRASGYWEGHLKAWQITSNGDILDSTGACALNDPLAPAECSAGPFLASATPFWDAGEVLSSTSPNSRNLSTSLGGTKSNFATSNGALDAAALGLSAADIATYDFTTYTPPANAAELRAMIIDNVRGCELGSTAGSCVARSWLLGDIFHAEPVLVPGPVGFLPGEGGYVGFRDTYGPTAASPRKRVIIAGANDGFLHIFDAGNWNPGTNSYLPGDGSEIAGFMPYAARQNAKELARDTNSRDYYFVDGSPSVADVWFYSSTTNNTQQTNGSEWRTVLVGGLRQGGNQYYALDVTDPSHTGACTQNSLNPTNSDYPCYLWEFPAEGAAVSETEIMGQTWSDPVITKIKVRVGANDNGGEGFDRWVAIFGTGYDPSSDPNDHANYDALSKAGRALVMVDVQTGAVIARKKFDDGDTSASTDDPATIAFNAADPERNMHFAFAATPGVYDLDDDGYADVIMAPDLGGNIWKWVIEDIADATGNEDQTGNWEFSRFFQAPSYLDSGGTGLRYWKSFFYFPSATQKNGNLWISVGSGQRQNLLFPGLTTDLLDEENNRIYAIVDTDPTNDLGVAGTITESDLIDATNDASGNPAGLSSSKGFYIVGEEGEKWVTETDIFFFVVLGASYIPDAAASPCENAGRSKLYAFTIYNGAGLFTSGSGAGAVPETSIEIGDGLPTAPQVTISTDPDGKTKVIINNQDGDIVDPTRCDTPPCPCDDSPCPELCPLPCFEGTGQMYWIER